ncbi:hypothetical protein [Amycolatopsis sp. NPDC003676]
MRAPRLIAVQDAYEVLLPRLSEVDAVDLGGDRRALDELRAVELVVRDPTAAPE